jgi:hypothetical protein
VIHFEVRIRVDLELTVGQADIAMAREAGPANEGGQR